MPAHRFLIAVGAATFFLPCDGIEQLASHVYQVPMQDEENLSQGFLRRTRQKFQTHEQASTSLFHEFLERVP